MSDPEQAAALAADGVAMEAFLSWQHTNGVGRKAAHEAYLKAKVNADRLWKIVGPDPLLSQLKKAQEVEDRRPNPDDPDDDDIRGADDVPSDGIAGLAK